MNNDVFMIDGEIDKERSQGINVLSLFDGISCGQVALERAGIKVQNYFASEIDKHAIKVTQSNYPDTKHIGDITHVKTKLLCLSEVYSYICSYDSDLQSKISEWEMIYWIDNGFTMSAKVGIQNPNEGDESTNLPCVAEMQFTNSDFGDFSKSKDVDDFIKPVKLQCSSWCYDYEVSSRSLQEKIRELQEWDETNDIEQDYWDILSLSKNDQVTVVEHKGGFYIFKGKIELLCGGSPCQGFSFAGKQLNFEDPRSKLFFEFIRLLEEAKPKYFLLENVVMKQEYQDVISQYLGCKPVKLNSALTSAQNRVRLYWSSFDIIEPSNKGIKLEDVLEDTAMIEPSAIHGRRLNKATILGRRLDKRGKRQDYDKNVPITQCLEVRASNRDKSNCLTTVAKDTVLTTMEVGRYPDAFNRKLPFRNYTKIERCRLMNLPDNYCDEISANQTVKATGNGWEVGMITHLFNCMISQRDMG